MIPRSRNKRIRSRAIREHIVRSHQLDAFVDFLARNQLDEEALHRTSAWQFDFNTLWKQWRIAGPKRVRFDGRMYQFRPKHSSRDKDALNVKYTAKKKKKRDEDFAPTVMFTISYDRGADLYNVRISHYDHKINKDFSKDVKGLTWEQFSNFGLYDLKR